MKRLVLMACLLLNFLNLNPTKDLLYAQDILCVPVAEGLEDNRETYEYLLQVSQVFVEQNFDPKYGMIVTQDGQLDVRDTAFSALVWAELGDYTNAEIAIQNVIDTQVTDSNDANWGNFPQFASENDPLFLGNWHSFIGSTFLVLEARHSEKLSRETYNRLLESISLAANRVKRIGFQPSHMVYTNTFLLNSFLVIRAAEVLQNQLLSELAQTMWAAFRDYSLNIGLTEFNATNYYKVDLYALGFMADYVENSEIASDANCLRQALWYTVSRRFNPSMLQLGGPYSRNISERSVIQREGLQDFLYRDSLGQIPLFFDESDEEIGRAQAVLAAVVSRSWPDIWLKQALDLNRIPSQFREQTSQLEHPRSDPLYQHITTYNSPRLIVGSVNHMQINRVYAEGRVGSLQSRPLIAHAQTVDVPDVGVFRLMPNSPTITVVNAVQQNQSVLVVILVFGFTYADAQNLDIHLQWLGSEDYVPQFTRGEAIFENQVNVEWMDHPVAVRFGPSLLPKNVVPNFAVHTSDGSPEDPTEIVLDMTLPLEFITDESASAIIPIVFAIHFGEINHAPIDLAPIEVGPKDGETLMFSWESPDGLLVLETASERTEHPYVVEYIDGEAIQAPTFVEAMNENKH